MTLGAVALITGAGKGIGRAIALRLARDGYNIALNDIRQQEGLESVKAEIKGMGREVIECIADVRKEGEVRGMVDDTVERLGGLDVMVANAGICLAKPFLESKGCFNEPRFTVFDHYTTATLEDWDQSFDVNGKGVFLCYKYAAKKMIEQGRGGRIIGASSLAGKQGFEPLAIYCATKFAVRALTQTAALALKPHGITVNAYAPGIVSTPLLAKLARDLENLESPIVSNDSDDVGAPEEIAALVSYLVSKEARYVTGQSISINGGRFFE